MQFLTAENRLTKLLRTSGFQQLRECLNVLLDQPVWWYTTGPEDSIHILESHNKTGCGLLHDDRSIREQWMEAAYAAISQAGHDKVALMAACPPERTQVVVPILCGDEAQGFLGLAHLPNFEQRRLYPLLPLLTQHLRQIAERERASEDLLAIQRLWKEVVSTLDLEVLLARILREIIAVLDANEGVVLLVDQEHRLVKSASIGFDPASASSQEFQISSTPYENKVFSWSQAAQMLSVGDPLRHWYFSLYPTPPEGAGVWGIPLSLGGRLLGLVLCLGREGGILLPHLDTALETLALGSSVAIRNALDFEQMRQKAVALGTVHSVYRLVSTTRMVGDLLDKPQILLRMAKLILQVLNVRKCSIMLVDESGVLQPCVKIGLEEGEIGTQALEIGIGPPGKAAQDAGSILVENPLLDHRFREDPPSFYPSRSYLSVPMFEAEVIGVMTVAERAGHPARFSEGDREVLHTMAEQAVIALLNIDFFEKQERIALKTMGVFDNLFETGDPDQQGQAHRLASLMEGFARYLKLDPQTRQLFQMAAFIHGISLLRVARDAVTEMENGKNNLKHIEVAVRMARLLELPETIVIVLRDHHEHFDGSGQPRGLKGEEISMGARMLAITDEYLRQFSMERSVGVDRRWEAVNRIREDTGIRFDPNLVQSLSEYLDSPPDPAVSNGVE
jgi:GAF domain-containing protein